MDDVEILRPVAEPCVRPLVDRLASLDHPELAAVLASVDRRSLSGDQLLLVVAAEARLLAWVQAGMAASLSEFAHCPPYVAHPSARLDEWQEFAGDEAAIVLKVSPITASNLVGQSIAAHRRHPHLWAAWRDGQVDSRKVAVVTRTTNSASDTVKAAVDAALFDGSARPGRLSARDITIGQTPGQLQRRAHAALVAGDPSAARVRTRTALRNRRVAAGADRDVPGVGFLSGCDIPLADIAAAYAHIDAIARGIKQLGDPRLLDQLRADVFIDLLIGNDPSPAPRPRDGSTTVRPVDPEPAGADEPEPRPNGPETHTSARTKPGVDLVVPIGMLADLAEAIRRGTVAEIAGFGLVPADVIARLVKQAAAQPSTWCLTAVDDTGRVVRHVRSQHDPTRAMRDFVDGRDRHCRFPAAPAERPCATTTTRSRPSRAGLPVRATSHRCVDATIDSNRHVAGGSCSSRTPTKPAGRRRIRSSPRRPPGRWIRPPVPRSDPWRSSMPVNATPTITRDGRTICFHTTGRPDADRSVVFMHPGPGSGAFDPDPDQTALRDVVLIGVDRPGYGGSDPYPEGKWPALGAAVDDVIAVLDHLGVTSTAVAGWSGGGRIALALAGRRPDLVERLAILATPAPNEEVSWVPPEQKAMVERLRGLTATQARARLAESLGAPTESAATADYWFPFLSSNDADGGIRDDPPSRARLDGMLEHGMAGGAGALADDILGYALQPWGFRPEDVQAKTLLLYGMADGAVPGAHARWWKNRLPTARIEMMPKLGHLLIVPAWKRALSHLAPGSRR